MLLEGIFPGCVIWGGSSVHMGLTSRPLETCHHASRQFVCFRVSSWCSCGAFGWVIKAPLLHHIFFQTLSPLVSSQNLVGFYLVVWQAKRMVLQLLIFWTSVVMFLRGSGKPGRHVPGTLFMTGRIQSFQRQSDGKGCTPPESTGFGSKVGVPGNFFSSPWVPFMSMPSCWRAATLHFLENMSLIAFTICTNGKGGSHECSNSAAHESHTPTTNTPERGADLRSVSQNTRKRFRSSLCHHIDAETENPKSLHVSCFNFEPWTVSSLMGQTPQATGHDL